MKNTIHFIFAFIFLFGSSPSAQNLSTEYYDGQLWVQLDARSTKGFQHNDDKLSAEPFIALIGSELANEFGLIGIRKPFHFATDPAIREVYQVNFSEAERALEFARRLEQLDAVNYAERVPIMRTSYTPNDLGPASGTNDQWFLYRIDAQEAWDISTGNTDIKVAIVDDAVLTNHPDLIPNLLPGYDVADNDADAMPNTPDMSHGTHVAGIASAATDNGVGVASIGFNVKLIPVKSSNSAQFVSDAYAGVVWAYQNDADVINMSWGGSGFSQTGQNIMNNAYNAGCVNVAAAGNDNTSTVFYPAGYDNVISVASTTTNDAKSGFSNYGSWIDIAAPGSAIRSTYIGNNFSATYADLQGTSMASPLVAGLCGLIKSVNPQMTQTQIENCLLSSADNINSANGNFIGQLGAGRINAYQAVLCAQTTLNAPPVAVINADNTVRCPGANVQFFGSSAGGLATGYQWSFPGGNPANSTAQNPIVNYSSLGTYNVSLTLTNQFGTDTETLNGYVEISTNGTDVFFSEDFESGTLAQNQWAVENPDNSVGWDIYSVAGATQGSSAAGINLFNYPERGQRDGLVSPVLDFSGHSNIQLDFQHAHRRYSTDYSDSLIIHVSTDGGSTYPDRVFAQAETGQGTFATNSILAQDFYPTNGIDWCFGGDLGSSCFTVDLSDFDGETNVRLKFETRNDYGNNIFLDNIELSGNCVFAPEPPIADFSASVTSLCSGESVTFNDQSANVPTDFIWSFPGGTPNSSSEPSPTITYASAGTFEVSLSVSNQYGSDQIVQTGYITVNQGPNLSLNETSIDLCEGETAQLIASGNGQSYTWTPSDGLSSTTGATVNANPTAAISYTVASTLNGCTAEATVDVEVNPVPTVPDVMSQNDAGFVVIEPSYAEGFHPYQAPSAWGVLPFNSTTAEGEMVIARSNANDSLLCSPAFNAQDVSGKIAVVYRGSCEFGTKALNAQNAGAIGVIIVNDVPGDATIDMGSGADGPSVSVPVIMVSANVGARINAAVNSGQARAVLAQFNGGSFDICPDESIRLAAPHGYDAYEWSNGDQTAVGQLSTGGQHFVRVFNEFGCEAESVTYNVNVIAVSQPMISENNGQLDANANGTSYQWYLNGEPIADSDQQEIPIQGSGAYTVEMVDANGCTVVSDPYEVTLVGILESDNSELNVWPNPFTDVVNLSVSAQSDNYTVEVFGADGRLIRTLNGNIGSGAHQIDMSGMAVGTYTVRLITESSSEEFQLIKH